MMPALLDFVDDSNDQSRLMTVQHGNNSLSANLPHILKF
jgi:hypothetical protein